MVSLTLSPCPTGGKFKAGGSEDDDDDDEDDDEELRHLEELDSEELGDEDCDDVGPVLQVLLFFCFVLFYFVFHF